MTGYEVGACYHDTGTWALGFATSSDGLLPDEWHTAPATSPANAAWFHGAAYPDVFAGFADLRFESDRYAYCASVESDRVVVAPVLVFSNERKNGYRFDDTNGQTLHHSPRATPG